MDCVDMLLPCLMLRFRPESFKLSEVRSAIDYVIIFGGLFRQAVKARFPNRSCKTARRAKWCMWIPVQSPIKSYRATLTSNPVIRLQTIILEVLDGKQ